MGTRMGLTSFALLLWLAAASAAGMLSFLGYLSAHGASISPDDEPLISVRVEPSSNVHGIRLEQNEKRLYIDGIRLIDLLSTVYEVPASRISGLGRAGKQRLLCEVVLSGGSKRAQTEVLKCAIEAAFSIRVTRGTETRKALILEAMQPPESLILCDEHSPLVEVGPQRYEGCASIAALGLLIERHLTIPVIDSTNVNQSFELSFDLTDVSADEAGLAALVKRFREVFGIASRVQEASVDTLVVSKRDEGSNGASSTVESSRPEQESKP